MKEMNSIKKKASKLLLSLTMVFAMVLTMIPTNVFAAGTPSATISNITINGVVGTAITNATVEIKIENAYFLGAGGPFDSYIKNLPRGIKTYYSEDTNPDYQIVTVEFLGTPTESKSEPIMIEFPADRMKHQEKLSVTPNSEAKWVIVHEYAVTVNSGDGTGKFAKDSTVTITANAPETGKHFKEWTVISGDVTLADPTSATTTFTMPEKDV